MKHNLLEETNVFVFAVSLDINQFILYKLISLYIKVTSLDLSSVFGKILCFIGNSSFMTSFGLINNFWIRKASYKLDVTIFGNCLSI